MRAPLKRNLSSRYKFSFFNLPDSINFRYVLFFVFLTILSFFLPRLVPEIGETAVIERVIQIARRKTSLEGFSHEKILNLQFLQLEILDLTGQQLSNYEFVRDLKAPHLNANLKAIYEEIAVLERIGTLDNHIDRYYHQILELLDTIGGFKIDLLANSSSISATYDAFMAIRKLNKFEQFRKSDLYNSSIQFVISLKDPQLYGFSDRIGELPTMEATYKAIQLIPSDRYIGIERFVYYCQAHDGGFSNVPIDSLSNYYKTNSDLKSTLQGLFILEILGKTLENAYTNANHYVRYMMTFSNDIDLESCYHFIKLIGISKRISYGIPRSISYQSFSFGSFCFIATIYFFYKNQIPDEGFGFVSRHLKNIFGILLFGYITYENVPTILWISIYIGLSIYLVHQYHDIYRVDKTNGMMVIVGCVNSILFTGLVTSFIYFSPFMYGQLFTFVILFGWTALSSFLATYGSCFFVGSSQQRLNFFVRAGFLGWVTNTMFFYLFLFARNEYDIFIRYMKIRGLSSLVLIGYPYVTLCICYLTSSISFLLFASNQ